MCHIFKHKIKYKGITVYINNKIGRGAQIIASKGILHFKCFQEKTKETKTNQEE